MYLSLWSGVAEQIHDVAEKRIPELKINSNIFLYNEETES